MPFCIDCGMRVAEGTQRCPDCLGRTSTPAACPNCAEPYTSPQAKFCMKCGTPRSETTGSPISPQAAAGPAAPAPPSAPSPGPQPIPQPPPVTDPVSPTTEPGGVVCIKCGRENKIEKAKFCVYCAEPLPAPQAPPETSADKAPPPEPPPARTAPEPASQPRVVPLTPEQLKLVESISQERLGVYQKTGRLLLAACRTGAVNREHLPPDLAGEIDGAFSALQGGHSRLVKSGICPQCQDVGFDPDLGKCAQCGLTVSRNKEGDK